VIHSFVRAVGATSVILEVFIENSASAGTGKTGLVFNTGSLTGYYKINSAAASVAITLATCTLGTFTSGGFKEIDSTHMPGMYELHVPDAAFASGGLVSIVLQGASGMFPCVVNVDMGAVAAILTQPMTESYATTTGAMTLAQALHMIWSAVANFGISSTTLTTRKLDNSTTAMTFTLDSATVPTSRTRAS